MFANAAEPMVLSCAQHCDCQVPPGPPHFGPTCLVACSVLGCAAPPTAEGGTGTTTTTTTTANGRLAMMAIIGMFFHGALRNLFVVLRGTVRL